MLFSLGRSRSICTSANSDFKKRLEDVTIAGANVLPHCCSQRKQSIGSGLLKKRNMTNENNYDTLDYKVAKKCNNGDAECGHAASGFLPVRRKSRLA